MAARILTGGAAALALFGLAGAAEAGLEICNDTDVFQSVAIGYLGDDWTSEGWWLIEPGGCAEPVGGDIDQQYYYLYALADGRRFQGEGFGFCIDDPAFTIVGLEECEGRGYQTGDFREIDTGETALHHVERITDSISLPDGAQTPPPEPEPVPEPEPAPEPDPVGAPDFAPDDRDANPRRGGSRG